MGKAFDPPANFEVGDQGRARDREDPSACSLDHQNLPGVAATLNYSFERQVDVG
jgi:hypothetical protein